MVWRPVGGAVEAVVRSARRVAANLFPFGGGALRSSVVEVPPFPSSRFYGAMGFVKPYPAAVWRPGWNLFNKEKEKLLSFAMKTVSCGVSSLELATGDSPDVKGMYLIQAFERYSGGGPPPAASSSSSTSGSGGPFCNFLFVLDHSVRTGL